MKIAIHTTLLLRLLAAQEDVRALSELPLSQLLVQKRVLEERGAEGAPTTLAFVGKVPGGSGGEARLKGLRAAPERKSFYEEDYEDEKGLGSQKKNKEKVHDVLNTSIMALSYLAFGGYLLCMIASALREKRRRYAMAYPTAASTVNNHFAQVLQHYMNQRPTRPFTRFPAVTLHQGRKRRRRRFSEKSGTRGAPSDSTRGISAIDYVGLLPALSN